MKKHRSFFPPSLQLTTIYGIMSVVEKKRTKSLCNEDCNNCEAITNPQVALLLNVLALQFGERVWTISNRVCANLTCCPICRIDDFCHDCIDAKSGIAAINEIGEGNESCEVANRAIEIFNQIKKEYKDG